MADTDNDFRPCICLMDRCVFCRVHLVDDQTAKHTCLVQGYVTKRDFGIHEVLFRAGSASSHLFALHRGLVKLTSLAPDGREQIIGLGIPGRLFGFQSMSDSRFRFSAESVSPVTVCTIKRDDMLRVLENSGAVSVGVVDLLNRELAEAHELICTLGHRTAEERVAWLLLFLRLAAEADGSETFPVWLSRREIAEFLGLTPETVSRFTAEFRRQGLIETQRGLLQILDSPGLEARATSAGMAPPRRESNATASPSPSWPKPTCKI
jgi:CRP/FNR family transcriptional regulator, anaerobic regulatory protein